MGDDVVSAEKYTLLQLKAWCTAVGINANGAKASLAARLSQLSEEARGLCPGNESVDGTYEVSDNVTGSNNESDSDADTIAAHNVADKVAVNVMNKVADKVTVNVAKKVAVNVTDKVADKATVNVADSAKDVAVNAAVDVATNEAGNAMVSLVDNSAEENAYYNVDGQFGVRMLTNREANGRHQLVNSVTSVEEADGERKKHQAESLKIKLLEKEIEVLKLKLSVEEQKRTHTVPTEFSFDTVKQLLSDYDGGENFELWRSQVVHLQQVLNVRKETLGLVVQLKLKGMAANWYNTNKMFCKSLDDVLREMVTICIYT